MTDRYRWPRPCPTCGEPTGEPCRTTSQAKHPGRVTDTHKARYPGRIHAVRWAIDWRKL